MRAELGNLLKDERTNERFELLHEAYDGLQENVFPISWMVGRIEEHGCLFDKVCGIDDIRSELVLMKCRASVCLDCVRGSNTPCRFWHK
jgi:hypothetical protein